VIAARIAAHAADLARGRPSALEQDRTMARQRKALNWKGQEEISLDPTILARHRRKGLLPEGEVCDMCGPYCSIKGMRDILGYAQTIPPRKGKRNPYGRASRGSDRKS
jgi:phosphomethylpyrimidine synthase